MALTLDPLLRLRHSHVLRQSNGPSERDFDDITSRALELLGGAEGVRPARLFARLGVVTGRARVATREERGKCGIRGEE